MNSTEDGNETSGNVNLAFVNEEQFHDDRKDLKKFSTSFVQLNADKLSTSDNIYEKTESKKISNNKYELHENKIVSKAVPEMGNGTSYQEKDAKPIVWTQIFGAVICSVVFMNAGIMHGYTGIILPKLTDANSDDLILSTFEVSVFSSIANIGACFGCCISGFTSVWLGQRLTFLIFLPIGMASWIILGFANAFWILTVSRILQGLVIGATIGIACSYVTEVAHSSIRGRLLALANFSFQSGIFIVYVLGSTSMTWRNVGLICGTTTMVIPFSGILFLPSSPRWLVIRGRVDEAEKALIFFRGEHYSVTHELKEIMKQSATERTTVKTQFEELMEGAMFYRFIVIAVVAFSIHFTGNIVMISYTVTIFESLNVPINSYLSTILAASIRIITIFIYVLLSDRVGRKQFFLPSQLLAGICTVNVGIYFYQKRAMCDVSAISWLPLTSLVCFTMFSSITGAVLDTWISELLPNSVRALGISLLYVAYYCGSFGAALSYPYMVNLLGLHWTFWIYGAISFMLVYIASKYIPETKWKSLEEIKL